jgi:hypothetical protein
MQRVHVIICHITFRTQYNFLYRISYRQNVHIITFL